MTRLRRALDVLGYLAEAVVVPAVLYSALVLVILGAAL